METAAAPRHRRHPLLVAGLAAALFGLILGAKWATVYRFGSDMPDWDQWDAEAMQLFVPWFEHDHFIEHLFHPHNEHRIVVTKLQNLTLALLNGQWDSRLECVFNAALHSGIAVAFWLLARRWTAPRWHAPLFVLTAALFGLPLAWQNILGGFHSQQYWLLGLSFAAIVILPFARPWSAPWCAGALATILALGTMGSGFLAAVMVALVIGFRLVRRESTLRDTWPVLAVMAALIAVGASTRVEVYYHQALKAKTAHDFILSIERSLAWPLRDHDWIGALLWLPWVLALWRTIRTRDRDESRIGQTIVALGGWVFIQLLATAYARGAGADYPASRYMDTPAFGIMVNGVALAWLLSGGCERERAARAQPLAHAGSHQKSFGAPALLFALGAAWLLTLGLGLQKLLEINLRFELPDAIKYYRKAESHMRGYLATNDPKQLAFPDIPFPSAEGLIERLAHPSLRALMPVIIRAPLAVQPADEASANFRANDASQLRLETAPRRGLSPATAPLGSLKTWGSFSDGGAVATDLWMSTPVTASLNGWLKFETAGQLGEPGVSLELHDALTGVLLDSVRATRVPGDTWRAAYVRAPRRPFIIVARDTDPKRWLAFSAPVEMGTLSYWAWQAAKNGLLLAYVAGAAGVALWIVALFAPPRKTQIS